MKISNLVSEALNAGCNEFIQLVKEAIELLSKEVKHLEIIGKLIKIRPLGQAVIIGDVHGDLESLMHILQEGRFMERANRDENILLIFLGDYGDRGRYSVEVYHIILRLKAMFPEKVILLRGNHEGTKDLLAYPHDLPAYLQAKFGKNWLNAYKKIFDLFDYFHNAVLVKERYLMAHGGIPANAKSIEDFAFAHKRHPNETFFEEILWSDPIDGVNGAHPSPRGAGRLFGRDITEKVLRSLNVNVFIRGHEPCENGFKINHGGRVLTLFSRKGAPYFNSYGAYLRVNLSEECKSAMELLPYISKF